MTGNRFRKSEEERDGRERSHPAVAVGRHGEVESDGQTAALFEAEERGEIAEAGTNADTTKRHQRKCNA